MLYTHGVMLELETTQTVPLTRWEDGSIRIAGSRVRYEYVVDLFKNGASAEHILEVFPSLRLKDIYGALFYYLDHTEAVEEYLKSQKRAEEEGYQFIQSHFDNSDLRERIRLRRAQMTGPEAAASS